MRPLLLIFILSLAFTACRKPQKHDYDRYSLSLNLQSEEEIVVFSWDAVQTDDFVSYELYGSEDSIPDLSSDGSLDAQLIFSSTKREQSMLRDSTGLSFVFKYFKLIARLENSILSSQNVRDNETIFLTKFKNSNALVTLPFPMDKKILFYENFGSSVRASIYDYAKNVFTAEDVDFPSQSANYIKFCIYNNQPALCNLYGRENGINKLMIYDLTNLSVLAAFPHPASVANFSTLFYLKNNHLVYIQSANSYNKLFSWDLNTNTVSTIDSALNGNYSYTFAPFNPKFVIKYQYASRWIYFYDVQANGNPVYTSAVESGANTFNGNITRGEQQFLQPTSFPGELKNRLWKLEESFNLDPNLFYLSESPNENYFAYQNNSFTNDLVISIYKRGQSEKINSLPFFNNFQSRATFLDNENLIFVLSANNFSQTNLFIKKFKLEE